MANIIIPKKRKRIARTRSEQAEIIKKEWGGHGGLSELQLDKCKFLERKMKEKHGEGASRFFRDADIRKVKSEEQD